jgi:acyl-coenzyme A synthetase/AMP-(fatty) acid ligase
LNITDFIRVWAHETPDAEAVLTPEGILSYAELHRAVSFTAKSFADAGLIAGDIVAIDLSNQTQHLIASLALARLGAGQFAFDVTDPPRLRQNIAERLKIVATIADSTRKPAPTTPLVDPPPGSLKELKDFKTVSFNSAEDSSLPFSLMRTSGTSTGVPKVGLLTHATAHPRIKTKGFGLPVGPKCRYMALGSLSFNSVKARAYHCLVSGGCLAFHDTVGELQQAVDFVISHRITVLSCSPVQASELLSLSNENDLLLPGVDALRLGSAFSHQALRENIQKHLTPNLYIAYGVTEVGTISIASPKLVRNVVGVVGVLVPGVQAEVVDEEGKVLPPDSAGLLRLKSPGMINSYIDAPSNSEQVFRNGWFYSDDVVTFTHNHELIHHGRADDVMIYDGININPAEIENALLNHPAVYEAAAFSIPSEIHGDLPVAVVVVKSEITEPELLSHCRSWLGLHSPQGLSFVPKLPRNTAGKVLKNELKKIFCEEKSAQSQNRKP